MAQACDEVYGLFDSSKVNGFGLHSFAATERSRRPVHRRDRLPDFVTEWKRLGVPVHTAVVRRIADLVIPAETVHGTDPVLPERDPTSSACALSSRRHQGRHYPAAGRTCPDKGVRMRPARRVTALIAISAAAAIALAGCTKKNEADTGGAAAPAPAPAAGETYKVAFVPKLQGVPYFEAMNAGGQEAAEELGNVEWLYQGPTQADAAAQADIVRSFIQQKVDTLIVAPNDPDSMAPLLQQAKDAGIHVATADTDAPNSVREVFVNQATAEGIGAGPDRRAAAGDGRQGQVRDRLLRPDRGEPELLDRGAEGLHRLEVPGRARSSTSSTPARTRPRPPRWRPT